MKTMFIREGLNMTVDPETNEIGSVSSAREAIQRIYVAPEPMHVIYQSGSRKEEADVEANDVIVTFYTDEFDKRMIIVKSEEWTKNIEAYNKRMEDAALKKAASCCDGSCDCECACKSLS
jgi:hypothetical protein